MSSCPGVDLALLIQPGFAGLPGEHIHVKRSEDAGCCDLIVLNVAGFHPQWLGASYRVKQLEISFRSPLHHGRLNIKHGNRLTLQEVVHLLLHRKGSQTTADGNVLRGQMLTGLEYKQPREWLL